MADREVTRWLLVCGAIELVAWVVAWLLDWPLPAVVVAVAVSIGVGAAIVLVQRRKMRAPRS